jgi:hypothetical protein
LDRAGESVDDLPPRASAAEVQRLDALNRRAGRLSGNRAAVDEPVQVAVPRPVEGAARLERAEVTAGLSQLATLMQAAKAAQYRNGRTWMLLRL